MRVSTGRMLATFSGGKHQRVLNVRVAGKLRFLRPKVLGPLVIVMTILSIIVRNRRNAVHFASSATSSAVPFLMLVITPPRFLMYTG
jgi:hypothetical protein